MALEDQFTAKCTEKYLTERAIWGVWDRKLGDWAAPTFRSFSKAEVAEEAERRNAEATRTVTLNLRLPVALHARIKDKAYQDHRSLNAAIIAAIEAQVAGT